jgi:hypothetical protein
MELIINDYNRVVLEDNINSRKRVDARYVICGAVALFLKLFFLHGGEHISDG